MGDSSNTKQSAHRLYVRPQVHTCLAPHLKVPQAAVVQTFTR